MSYQLSILTPSGEIFNGKADFAVIPGILGELGILSSHAPIVSAIKPGVVTITQDKQKKFFAVDAGVLEVKPNHSVMILTDQAMESGDLKEARTQSSRFIPSSTQ